MKRPAPADEGPHSHHNSRPTKRLRPVVGLPQSLAVESLSAMQDDVFHKSQLLRSIGLALSAVGFDAVAPAALEAFRADVEAYMLHLTSIVQQSMASCRRTTPVPQDFIIALAHVGLSPRHLVPHTKLPRLPEALQPTILPLPAAAPESPKVDAVLGSELSSAQETTRRKWLPKHLPPLPSRHAWQRTPVFATREFNAHKTRELATKEGVLAEQALRRLVASSRTKHAAAGGSAARRSKSSMVWEEAMKAIEQVDEKVRRAQEAEGVEMPGLMLDGDRKHTGGIGVNWERSYWPVKARARAQ